MDKGFTDQWLYAFERSQKAKEAEQTLAAKISLLETRKFGLWTRWFSGDTIKNNEAEIIAQKAILTDTRKQTFRMRDLLGAQTLCVLREAFKGCPHRQEFLRDFLATAKEVGKLDSAETSIALKTFYDNSHYAGFFRIPVFAAKDADIYAEGKIKSMADEPPSETHVVRAALSTYCHDLITFGRAFDVLHRSDLAEKVLLVPEGYSSLKDFKAALDRGQGPRPLHVANVIDWLDQVIEGVQEIKDRISAHQTSMDVCRWHVGYLVDSDDVPQEMLAPLRQVIKRLPAEHFVPKKVRANRPKIQDSDNGLRVVRKLSQGKIYGNGP